MYTFIDKGGRSMTLRPEYTPSVVRAIVEHRLDLLPEPMRYYYMGPMFRYDKPQKGRYRQFHQVDVEVFGEKDPALDAEIIEMADALLRTLGVDRDRDPGQLGRLPGLPAGLQRGPARSGREAPGRALRGLPAEGRDESAAHLRLQGRGLPGRRRGVPPDPGLPLRGMPGPFRRLPACLDLYGLPYRVDPSLVRGLDYYTKTTFEIVILPRRRPRTPSSAAAATTT